MENTKVLEALKKLLPDDQVNEVASAIEDMIAESKTDLEKQYNEKLDEAYTDLTDEIAEKERIGYEGYQEAYGVIQELRNRLEVQREAFEEAMHENYEQAFEIIQSEKAKNESVEVDLYEEMDKRVQETRNFIVDKVHQFLQDKAHEIYEQAKRDVLNDPRYAERNVVLDKIVENVSAYLSDEDYSAVTSSKIEELNRSIEDLKGQVRLSESRNIRLDTDYKKTVNELNEARKAIASNNTLLEESTKKETARKAQAASGRGNRVLLEDEELIPEPGQSKIVNESSDDDSDLKESALHEIQVLAGLRDDD